MREETGFGRAAAGASTRPLLATKKQSISGYQKARVGFMVLRFRSNFGVGNTFGRAAKHAGYSEFMNSLRTRPKSEIRGP